jgi:hypothetical protein
MTRTHILLSGLFALATVACSPSSDQAPAASTDKPAVADTTAKPAPAVTAPAPASAGTATSVNDDNAVAKVSEAVQRHHLTKLSPDCLDYIIGDESQDGVDVDVHEKHDEHCGGDPETSPRLFSFHVDHAGKLTTDALDPGDAQMKPID